jgi:hypothetical protein
VPLKTVIETGIKTLFHYQKYEPEHLADLLKRKRRIFCSTPGHLNDPWDCRPWYDFTSIKEAAGRREYLDWYHRNAPPDAPPELRAKVDEIFSSNDDDLEEALAGLSHSMQEEIADRRIYCLTPDPRSILMWSHYADNHRGVCLVFDTDNALFRTARAVTYRDAYPIYKPHEMGPHANLETVYTKSEAWSYEAEYRVLGIRSAPGSALQLDGNYLELPDGALQALIIGCEADEWEIRQFLKEHAPDLAVKRAVRANGHYRLEISD